jgi:hypothetical protein
MVLVYAISQAPQAGWESTPTFALLSLAAILLIAFLVVETRVKAPLLPLRLFRIKTVAGANAVAFLLTASFYTFVFVGTLYMQQVLGYSALKTGLAWIVASVSSVAMAGLSQKLVTRTSARFVVVFGMTFIGAGILWATRVPASGHFWQNLAGPIFVAGIGTAFSFIPVSIGALGGIAEREAGVASGLLSTSQQLGGAIGVAVASTVAVVRSHSLLAQGHPAAAALTSGFQWALWVCGLTGLVAVPVALGLIRRRAVAPNVATSKTVLPDVPVPATAD